MFYVKNLLHKKNGLYNVQLYTPKGSNHWLWSRLSLWLTSVKRDALPWVLSSLGIWSRLGRNGPGLGLGAAVRGAGSCLLREEMPWHPGDFCLPRAKLLTPSHLDQNHMFLLFGSALLCLFSIQYNQAGPSRNRYPVSSLLGFSRLPLRLQAIPAPSPTSIISLVPELPCCSSYRVRVSPVECPSSWSLDQRGLPLALPSSAYLESLTPAPSFACQSFIPKQCCFTIGQQPSPA